MIPPVYTLEQVASSMGVSERFLRGYLKKNDVEHMRVGNGPNGRIRFTEAQVTNLHAQFRQSPVPESVTTGRRKRSA